MHGLAGRSAVRAGKDIHIHTYIGWLVDPLSELVYIYIYMDTQTHISTQVKTHTYTYTQVKIEPSALGVGMYQKDLPPKELAARLEAATEDAVAAVGVEVNGASVPLLQAHATYVYVYVYVSRSTARRCHCCRHTLRD